jgi:hypothetical protein
MIANNPLALFADLAVLARALEVRGVYNGSKLLRAALDAGLCRLAVARAPLDDTAVLAALNGLSGRLTAAGFGTVLTSSIAAIVDSVRDGSILPLAAAPAACVCRVCGELFVGDVPLQCPTCEAPVAVFREHLPVWFLEPATRAEVLRLLETGIGWVEAAIGSIDDARLAQAPHDGEWSARDTMEHLLSTELILAARIERLLSEDRPDLAALTISAASPALDEATQATGESASALVRRFAAARQANRDRLAALPDEAWLRSGQHSEWGTVTILSQAAYFARHQASHTAQLAAAAEGRVPDGRIPVP